MKRLWIVILAIVCIVGIYMFATYDITYHNDVFRGESEAWKGEYRINGWWIFSNRGSRIEFDSQVDGVLTLTYLKEVEEPPKLDHFEIHCDFGAGGESLIDEDVVLEPIYRFERLGTNVPGEGSELSVVIDMDGDIQTIELVKAE